ncbi:DNA-protecting protein DprA [Candidatus Peregrinibacteria bacterium CG10_big_fil_rev_8_21_14_0_10_55_24]|nr:MAG: DNA-protecting protein DprA [Candidatus Peregrinibacteria bacterium CG10_big_fil_rev_8_21_14_0_10_55_24]
MPSLGGFSIISCPLSISRRGKCYNAPPVTAQTALTWSWLNILTKRRYEALLAHYADLDTALDHLNEEVLRALGCREETVLKTLNRLEAFDPEAYGAELARRSVTFVTIEGEDYPRLLKELPDAPVFLYAWGDLEILSEPCIALVGTRAMTSYGKRVTEEFVPTLVRAGLITISGLAQGVDTQVARSTLDSSGRTVAVLGYGLARIQPQASARLAQEIVKNGGLILSEFPLDTTPDKYTFPARNRIIAGLSRGTVVLEAGEGSGALITADLALDYGREVFAVPGDIFSEHAAGCHDFIAQGRAKLVSQPQQVLRDIGVVAPQTTQRVFKPDTDAEAAVFRVLAPLPQSVEDLVAKSGMQTASVNATLTMLELKGAARSVGAGQWVRC